MLSLKIPPHLKCVATLPCEMSTVLKAIILHALSSSNINRFSQIYLLILLPVLSDVITDVMAFGQCFSKVVFVYKEFFDYESGTLNF